MRFFEERLASILRSVLPVDEEPDGGFTVRHEGTFASLRVVNIVDGLDLVSLTQILAWDLPMTKKIGDEVARQARDTNFGAVTVIEKTAERTGQCNSGKAGVKTVDVMLRYNFPGVGLPDEALRTLILLVLDTGSRIRQELTGGTA